jgi:transcriptional regulator with XRE-family HTH domain
MPRHAVIIDAKVGRRVTLRRRQLKISQTALGKAVGVTFQQIQKYESGKNRIPSGRAARADRARHGCSRGLVF